MSRLYEPYVDSASDKICDLLLSLNKECGLQKVKACLRSACLNFAFEYANDDGCEICPGPKELAVLHELSEAVVTPVYSQSF
jgi:hypothetical protein